MLALGTAVANKPVVQGMTGFDSVSEDSIDGSMDQVFGKIFVVVAVGVCGKGGHWSHGRWEKATE